MTESIEGKPTQPNLVGEELRILPMHIDFGERIGTAIAKAIERANVFGEHEMTLQVAFEFNGVNVSVKKDSNPSLIYRDWKRALNGYIGSEVGPYPLEELTEVDRANDARIEAENEERRQRTQEEYRAKEAEQRHRVGSKLKNAPGIELANEEVWQSFKDANQDGPGLAIISYSETWARLMQIEMTKGVSLEDIAESTSEEADLEGITGLMYGAAVSTLAQTWKHGEQLRRWHNLKTQLQDEGERANEDGGVLNPALLRIGY